MFEQYIGTCSRYLCKNIKIENYFYDLFRKINYGYGEKREENTTSERTDQ